VKRRLYRKKRNSIKAVPFFVAACEKEAV